MTLLQPSQSNAPPMVSRPSAERRQARRTRVAFRARIRPIHEGQSFLEEVCKTQNVSRGGIYFTCDHPSYCPNMHLYVSCPDSSSAFDRAAEMARIIRVDRLEGGAWGIAVHFLHSDGYHPAMQRTLSDAKGEFR
jgi:hypothetical protein